MTNKKNESCGPRNFEEAEQEILALTKNAVGIAYPIYWDGLNLLKDVINLLAEETTKSMSESEKKYSKAYLMLINRAIQHTESARLLTERGLYGDSFVLTRSLMSDLSMMQYLHFHPNLLDLFLDEKQEDYQKNKEFKTAFNETAIEKDLVGRGVKSFASAFQTLSKASHASSFGSQLYGSMGKKRGQYHLNYGPKFQPEKTLMLMDMFVSSYCDLINNVLWHRYHSKTEIDTDDWRKIKTKLSKLTQNEKIFTEATGKTIKALYPNFENQKQRGS
ncbi:MAG: hypothetical protein WC878_06110 [Candidatus Paceibacterota bacterium]|jgi:hypothetical protein